MESSLLYLESNQSKVWQNVDKYVLKIPWLGGHGFNLISKVLINRKKTLPQNKVWRNVDEYVLKNLRIVVHDLIDWFWTWFQKYYKVLQNVDKYILKNSWIVLHPSILQKHETKMSKDE